jgi:hypothetical protein
MLVVRELVDVLLAKAALRLARLDVVEEHLIGREENQVDLPPLDFIPDLQNTEYRIQNTFKAEPPDVTTFPCGSVQILGVGRLRLGYPQGC